MKTKNFILTSIIVFMVFGIIDYITHAGILSGLESTQGFWRPEHEMASKMWIMYFAAFIFSFFFVYIFSKGYENKGIMEGLRYGLIVGILMNLTGVFSQYVVYPIPYVLAIQWFAYGMIQFIICGIIVSLLYKPVKAEV